MSEDPKDPLALTLPTDDTARARRDHGPAWIGRPAPPAAPAAAPGPAAPAPIAAGAPTDEVQDPLAQTLSGDDEPPHAALPFSQAAPAAPPPSRFPPSALPPATPFDPPAAARHERPLTPPGHQPAAGPPPFDPPAAARHERPLTPPGHQPAAGPPPIVAPPAVAPPPPRPSPTGPAAMDSTALPDATLVSRGIPAGAPLEAAPQPPTPTPSAAPPPSEPALMRLAAAHEARAYAELCVAREAAPDDEAQKAAEARHGAGDPRVVAALDALWRQRRRTPEVAAELDLFLRMLRIRDGLPPDPTPHG